MIRTAIALLSAALLASASSGQRVAPETVVLRSGTPVSLRTSEGLTTEGKKLRIGQRFQLEVAENVEAGGVIIIPAGSPATGEVTEVRNKGMWGKSGGINARVLFARVNGRQIRMTGQLDDKGTTGTAGVVGALVVVPIAGFFVTGTSARIPSGSPVKGFLDEDVPVSMAAYQTPPTMPASTPAAIIPAAVTTAK